MRSVVAVVFECHNVWVALGNRGNLINTGGVAASHDNACVVPISITVAWLERTNVKAVLPVIGVCHHEVGIEVRVMSAVVHFHPIRRIHHIVVDAIETASIVSIESLRSSICAAHKISVFVKRAPKNTGIPKIELSTTLATLTPSEWASPPNPSP
jgi:hypothetical protein